MKHTLDTYLEPLEPYVEQDGDMDSLEVLSLIDTKLIELRETDFDGDPNIATPVLAQEEILQQIRQELFGERLE